MVATAPPPRATPLDTKARHFAGWGAVGGERERDEREREAEREG